MSLFSEPSRTDFCLDLSSNEKRSGRGVDAVKPRDGVSHELHWRETHDQIHREKPGAKVNHAARGEEWVDLGVT